ncbi:MAG: SCO family protein [Aestuariivirga sp.]
MAWAAVAAAVAIAAAIWFGSSPLGDRDSKPLLPVPGIGGPFAMTDHTGKTFTEANLGGRPTLMFFGFTSCPDICPTTLTNISGWLKEFGDDANKINPIFVTVDPERDTPGVLKDYLTSFDDRIVGLTGTPEQLAAMAKAYRFLYAKVDGKDGDYTMDHTATVYLLDGQARFVMTIDYHEVPSNAAAKLRRLLNL